jgi:hypothetical protein
MKQARQDTQIKLFAVVCGSGADIIAPPNLMQSRH